MLLQTAKILIRKAGVVVMFDDMAGASMGNHEKSGQAYAATSRSKYCRSFCIHPGSCMYGGVKAMETDGQILFNQ